MRVDPTRRRGEVPCASVRQKAIAQATRAVLDMWAQVAAIRQIRRTDDGGYDWDADFRKEKAFAAVVEAILEMLLPIEAVQRQGDDKDGAFRTLLLAVKSADLLPRSTGSVRAEARTAMMCHDVQDLAVSGTYVSNTFRGSEIVRTQEAP